MDYKNSFARRRKIDYIDDVLQHIDMENRENMNTNEQFINWNS